MSSNDDQDQEQPPTAGGETDVVAPPLRGSARHTLRSLFVAIAAAIAFAPLAHADPAPDPHMPNPLTGYCPGGGLGNLFEGYCDGVKYPDGSYWHRIQYGDATLPWFNQTGGQPTQLGLSCVVDPDNSPIPQPAPPGGCGGAVK